MSEDPRSPGRWTGPALFAAAAAGCLFFAAPLLARPVEDLVGHVADDGFYYLQIARNLAAAGSPSLDGVHATNGYHPAWMLVCTILAFVFGAPETLLRAALVASLVLHLGTALLLVRLARRLGASALWAWLVGALWAISPLPVTLAFQAVEATAQVFALVLLLDAVARVGRDAARRDLVRLGLCAGLLFWARTDGLLLAPVAIGIAAAGTGLRAAPRAAGVAAGVFAATTLPWFAWSLATTGSLVQDSAAIKMLWADHAAGDVGLLRRLAGARHFLAQKWFALPASVLTASPEVVGVALALAFAALVAAGIVVARKLPTWGPALRVTAFLAASALGLGVLYGAFFTDHMVWYYAVPGLALFLTGALWIGALAARLPLLRSAAAQTAAAALLLLASMALFSRYAQRLPYEYPWQRDVLASQRDFDATVAPQARIGCFNAGVPAYFGARKVVNLDGLVNHDLVAVYREGTLDRWLQREGIAFIADDPLALGRAQRLTRNAIPLTPVATSPLRGWIAPSRFLWKVEAR